MKNILSALVYVNIWITHEYSLSHAHFTPAHAYSHRHSSTYTQTHSLTQAHSYSHAQSPPHTHSLPSRLTHTQAKATVKRDGIWSNIDAAEVVPGDLVLLACGSAIPADSRINEGQIEVDQAALTGESLPVTMYKVSTYVRVLFSVSISLIFHILLIDAPYLFFMISAMISFIIYSVLSLILHHLINSLSSNFISLNSISFTFISFYFLG